MKSLLVSVCAVVVVCVVGAIALESRMAPGSRAIPVRAATAPPIRVRAATPHLSPQPRGVGGAWRLRFDDEFNGHALDLSRWQPNWRGASSASVTAPDDPRGLSCMDPRQVTEGHGHLELAAIARRCVTPSGRVYRYASGLIETRRTFTFTYGFMQARILIPAAHGVPVNFPGFWATGTGKWPAAGEIDVLDFLEPCRRGLGVYFTSLHHSAGTCVRTSRPQGWHTFGAEWEPRMVRYFFDGKLIGQVREGVTHTPMFLVVNNSLDAGEGGPVSVPATLAVDYVRVWQ